MSRFLFLSSFYLSVSVAVSISVSSVSVSVSSVSVSVSVYVSLSFSLLLRALRYLGLSLYLLLSLLTPLFLDLRGYHSAVPSLSRLTNLCHLDLGTYDQYQSAHLPHFTCLTRLEDLRIRNHKLHMSEISSLQLMPSLRHLRIRSFSRTRVAECLHQQCPHLHVTTAAVDKQFLWEEYTRNNPFALFYVK